MGWVAPPPRSGIRGGIRESRAPPGRTSRRPLLAAYQPRDAARVSYPLPGLTRPLRSFGPRTDLMGIAVQGRTLYLTSFLGLGGKDRVAKC